MAAIRSVPTHGGVVASRKGYESFEEKLEFSVESPQASVVIDLVESEEEEERDDRNLILRATLRRLHPVLQLILNFLEKRKY